MGKVLLLTFLGLTTLVSVVNSWDGSSERRGFFDYLGNRGGRPKSYPYDNRPIYPEYPSPRYDQYPESAPRYYEPEDPEYYRPQYRELQRDLQYVLLKLKTISKAIENLPEKIKAKLDTIPDDIEKPN